MGIEGLCVFGFWLSLCVGLRSRAMDATHACMIVALKMCEVDRSQQSMMEFPQSLSQGSFQFSFSLEAEASGL